MVKHDLPFLLKTTEKVHPVITTRLLYWIDLSWALLCYYVMLDATI